MARLMGFEAKSINEHILYQFAMEKLPDYVYVAFEQHLTFGSKSLYCDSVFIIPHMGVIVVEVRGALRDVRRYSEHLYGQLQEYRFGVYHYLKEQFNVSLPVYNMVCFPRIRETDDLYYELSGRISREKIITADDMTDGEQFLMKMYQCCCIQKKTVLSEFNRRYMISDLTDSMAHDIYYNWDTGMARPGRPPKPPLLFMSYNCNNDAIANEIKASLERREIFVWRAPEDVKLGEFYLPSEMAAIEQCDAFLILLSTPAQESGEVRKEFERARELGKRILPVWVEKCKPNEYYSKALTRYQYRIMDKIDQAVLDEIVSCVRE